MGQAALALDWGFPPAAQDAIQSLAKAIGELRSDPTAAMIERAEARLLDLEAQAAISLNSLRTNITAKLSAIERIALDGGKVPLARAIEQSEVSRREIASNFRSLTKDLEVVARAVVRFDRRAGSFIRETSRRVEIVAEAWDEEYRSIGRRLRAVNARMEAGPKDGRLTRALAAYRKAFQAVFPYALPKDFDIDLIDGIPFYRIKMQIAPSLYRDTKKLVSMETEVDALVAEEAPDAVGLLSIEYEPMSGAA